MDLRASLEEFVKQRKGDGLLVATVTSVDVIGMTMDCVDGDGNEYLDVRLNAVPGVEGVIAVPQQGASVLITDLGDNAQEYVMLQAGTIQQVRLHTTLATEVYIDDEVIVLGNGGKTEWAVLAETLNENLAELLSKLDALVAALQTFTTAQIGVTAGVLSPLNPAYTALSPQLVAVKASIAAIEPLLNNHLSSIVKVAK